MKKDAQSKPLPWWMRKEKPWKKCDGCLVVRQTDKKKCGRRCGGTLKSLDKRDD